MSWPEIGDIRRIRSFLPSWQQIRAPETEGLPLDAFRRLTPPGWKPYLQRYPFRRWLERLTLWYRQPDLDITQVGPAVASRLGGKPFNLAMVLRTELSTGETIGG